MTIILKLKVALLFVCIALFVQNYAFAKDAMLKDIVVTNTRDDLLVYLNVEGLLKKK